MRRDGPRVEARARLDALLTQTPSLSHFHVGEILRVSDDSIVAKGWDETTPVVLKLFIGPQAAATVTAMQAELAQLARHMATGRCQVNRMILAQPALGLAVLSDLPGEKMSRLLPRATPDARARMLADAGQFVLAYSAGRRKMDVLGAGFWMRKFGRFDMNSLTTPDRALLRELQAALETQAQGLKGAPLCRAAIHGDFVPANLNADDAGVYGFDTQGMAVLPLSLDAARFLAWLAMEEVIPAGPQYYGVARSDAEAFLVKGLPVAAEHPGVLPFLLGHELAGRFYERHKDSAAAPHARRALNAYLAQN